MGSEIRKLRDLGNGSYGVVIPPDHLEEIGLKDGSDVVEGHLYLSVDDEENRVGVSPVRD
ncbi:hypothetical protein [Halorubrum sp. F4]|uniref:hypothetical protein n=1 Tax=Halorubrum sp. F4 TaxID=2989715 RepID=UPI002481513B|nr:hypothetical protein [Halorubrum sp. F4]